MRALSRYEVVLQQPKKAGVDLVGARALDVMAVDRLADRQLIGALLLKDGRQAMDPPKNRLVDVLPERHHL